MGLNIKKYVLLSFVAVIVPACAEFGYNPLDPDFQPEEERAAIDQSSTLLSYDLVTLSDGVSLADKTYHDEGAILETRRDWKGRVTDAPTASMVLLEATGATMPPVPGDPKEARGLWKQYNWRTVEYFDLYETHNSIGHVLWRRFLVGGRLCVIFQQGWGGLEGATASHVLAGYYCNSPGDSFSDGQAETVVQSIRVWEES